MSDNPFKSYFSFTRKERYGITALLVLIALLIGIRWYISTIKEDHFDTVAQKRYQKYYNEYVANQSSKKSNADTVVSEVFDNNAPDSLKSVGFININTVDSITLIQLKGIGPAKAHLILAFRNQNGAFKNINEFFETAGLPRAQQTLLAPHLVLQ